MGIRYWRQDYSVAIPRYEVFRVIGLDPNSGAYWFESVTQKTLFFRSWSQLNTRGFHPFLLDDAGINQFIAEGGRQYANP